MIIRILLLAGLASVAFLVFLRRNKMPFHIVTVFGLLAAGVGAIVFPNVTSDVAQMVGVGRGADLITYISLVAVLFVLVHYYGKFVELQRNVTQLARELTILRGEMEQHQLVPPKSPSATSHARPESAAHADPS